MERCIYVRDPYEDEAEPSHTDQHKGKANLERCVVTSRNKPFLVVDDNIQEVGYDVDQGRVLKQRIIHCNNLAGGRIIPVCTDLIPRGNGRKQRQY